LLALGDHIVEHVHPHAHALIKLEGPDSHFTVAGCAHPVRDDTLIAIDPWIPHAGPTGAAVGVTRVLALYIDISDPAAATQGHPLTARKAVFRDACCTLSPPLRQAAHTLGDRMSKGCATSDEVGLLAQLLMSAYGQSQSLAPSVQTQMDFRIRRVLRQMQHDLKFAQDVNACASVACLSRSHFFHLFRQNTGVSPQLFFNALRLELAMELLGSSSEPIHSVAEQLGFGAAGHFTRFFLHHTGSTPRAYRRGALCAR
jgi:AraC-like DNA-binding protein